MDENDDRYPWHIEVDDAHDRPRAVRIRTDRGRVHVATPPGEGFSMNPDQCDTFSASLHAACDRVRRQR